MLVIKLLNSVSVSVLLSDLIEPEGVRNADGTSDGPDESNQSPSPRSP